MKTLATWNRFGARKVLTAYLIESTATEDALIIEIGDLYEKIQKRYWHNKNSSIKGVQNKIRT